MHSRDRDAGLPGAGEVRQGEGGEESRGVVILALDVGEKRIGVAASDELEFLASPRGVIRRQSTAHALAAIERAVAETRAGQVVVGLPVSFDGHLHAQAHAIQTFAAKLARRLSIPVVFADETLSSVRAEEQLRAAGVRPERIRERLDAAAAALILQEYLDQRRQTQRPGDARPDTATTDTDHPGETDDTVDASERRAPGPATGGSMEDMQLP